MQGFLRGWGFPQPKASAQEVVHNPTHTASKSSVRTNSSASAEQRSMSWNMTGWLGAAVGTDIDTGDRDGRTQRRLDFTLTLYLLRVCDKFPVKYNHMTDSVLVSIGSSLRKILWRILLRRTGGK